MLKYKSSKSFLESVYIKLKAQYYHFKKLKTSKESSAISVLEIMMVAND